MSLSPSAHTPASLGESLCEHAGWLLEEALGPDWTHESRLPLTALKRAARDLEATLREDLREGIRLHTLAAFGGLLALSHERGIGGEARNAAAWAAAALHWTLVQDMRRARELEPDPWKDPPLRPLVNAVCSPASGFLFRLPGRAVWRERLRRVQLAPFRQNMLVTDHDGDLEAVATADPPWQFSADGDALIADPSLSAGEREEALGERWEKDFTTWSDLVERVVTEVAEALDELGEDSADKAAELPGPDGHEGEPLASYVISLGAGLSGREQLHVDGRPMTFDDGKGLERPFTLRRAEAAALWTVAQGGRPSLKAHAVRKLSSVFTQNLMGGIEARLGDDGKLEVVPFRGAHRALRVPGATP